MKKSKGYVKYTTKSGVVRYSSILIINRKVHRIASHDCESSAVTAHLKALGLIKEMTLQHVKEQIRMETIQSCDFSRYRYRNVFKHRNKFYFRYTRKGEVFHSSGYSSDADAYSACIEHRLRTIPK